MERDEPGFPELRLADGKDTALEVDIDDVQCQCLARPKTRRREESDQCRVGHRAQPRARGKSTGLLHETTDFLIGVDVRLCTPVAGLEDMARRDLRSRVKRTQPSGELPDHGKPPCPGRRLYLHWLQSPVDGELRGDNLRPFLLEKVHEAAKRYGRLAHLRAEGAADCDVLLESFAETDHLAPPAQGHGRATVRRASKSTLA